MRRHRGHVNRRRRARATGATNVLATGPSAQLQLNRALDRLTMATEGMAILAKGDSAKRFDDMTRLIDCRGRSSE